MIAISSRSSCIRSCSGRISVIGRISIRSRRTCRMCSRSSRTRIIAIIGRDCSNRSRIIIIIITIIIIIISGSSSR